MKICISHRTRMALEIKKMNSVIEIYESFRWLPVLWYVFTIVSPVLKMSHFSSAVLKKNEKLSSNQSQEAFEVQVVVVPAPHLQNHSIHRQHRGWLRYRIHSSAIHHAGKVSSWSSIAETLAAEVSLVDRSREIDRLPRSQELIWMEEATTLETPDKVSTEETKGNLCIKKAEAESHEEPQRVE